jgi:hypothetical protein
MKCFHLTNHLYVALFNLCHTHDYLLPCLITTMHWVILPSHSGFCLQNFVVQLILLAICGLPSSSWVTNITIYTLVGAHVASLATTFTWSTKFASNIFIVPCIIYSMACFVTSKNWSKYNHSICNYMRLLLVICDYLWTFLQLFLVGWKHGQVNDLCTLSQKIASRHKRFLMHWK